MMTYETTTTNVILGGEVLKAFHLDHKDTRSLLSTLYWIRLEPTQSGKKKKMQKASRLVRK